MIKPNAKLETTTETNLTEELQMAEAKFTPKFDIAAIIKDIKPEVKTARAKKEAKERGPKLHTSIKSGFPGIRALHEYVFANSPDIAENQMKAIMDVEYPAKLNAKGNLQRVDAKGDFMLDNSAKPLLRNWDSGHFKRYQSFIMGKNEWNFAEELGLTEEQTEAAHEAFIAEDAPEEVVE
jgi:hypothetical protein